MDKDIVLRTVNLKKIYSVNTINAVTALRDVNVQVHRGEFLGVMGPSGSGKSTFINIISTMDYPTDGSVFIYGKNVMAMSANEIGHFRYANLGFIFQSFNLLDTHTVFENIALPLTLAGCDCAEIEERVTAIAKQLNIEPLLSKLPPECSVGQRQRTAIARALINNAGLIVADEPTGNLDSENSEELMELFRKLNEERGTTIVMVTHDAYIASFTSRLMFIRDGMLAMEITREGMDQDTYFRRIVEISSSARSGRRSL